MRRVIGLMGTGLLLAATAGPPRQAAVSLVADAAIVDISAAEPSGDALTVDVVVRNLGDGDAMVTAVRIEGGDAWRLVDAWEPVLLAAGGSVGVSVLVNRLADVDNGVLIFVAEGASESAVGCSPGVEVASDTLRIPLLGVPVEACDVDEDGALSLACGGLDCDDTDAAVHPAAEETCNERDDNCDGDVDEGLAPADSPFHPDQDGDGFGDADVAVSACRAPAGHIVDASDCDDTDPDVHPDAAERCNDRDDDCDGSVDELGPHGVPARYVDSDADGFGAADSAFVACGSTVVTSPNNADCDDADHNVNPDATEVCNQRDEDCDGSVDNGFVRQSWYPDADGDGGGRRAALPIKTCQELTGHVNNNDDCIDTDGTTLDCACAVPGPESLVLGAQWVEPGAADAELFGPLGTFGEGVLVADVSGDGCAEVLVSGGGTVWVFAGPLPAELSTQDALAVITGDDPSFGTTLSSGDFNADGFMDVVVTAPNDAAGTVYVFSGPLSGTLDTDDASVVMMTDRAGHSLGTGVAVGDLNTDGIIDLVLGEPNDPMADGSVWIVYGPVSGSHLLADRADVVIHGGSVGTAVAVVGDVTGDGLADLVIGGVPPFDPELGLPPIRGSIGLYAGPVNGDRTHPADAFQMFDTASFNGTRSFGTAVGSSVVALGDYSGDGRPDFAATAPQIIESVLDYYDVFYGAVGRFLGTNQGAAIAPPELATGSTQYPLARVIAAAGDVDGDGLADLLTSGVGHGGCRPSGGNVGILFGGPPRGFRWQRSSPVAYDGLGTALGAGDINADGLSDVVLTAPGSGITRIYLGAQPAERPPPIVFDGFGSCLLGPADAPVRDPDVETFFSLDGVVVEPSVRDEPLVPFMGVQTCTSGRSLLAAFETADGDEWEWYGSEPLDNASLNVGDPIRFGWWFEGPLNGSNCVGRATSFAAADSDGLLIAQHSGSSLTTWSNNPLHEGVSVRGACMSTSDRQQFTAQLVLDGQHIPSGGMGWADIQGGTVRARGGSSYSAGVFPCSQGSFSLVRD